MVLLVLQRQEQVEQAHQHQRHLLLLVPFLERQQKPTSLSVVPFPPLPYLPRLNVWFLLGLFCWLLVLELVLVLRPKLWWMLPPLAMSERRQES